jgi:serine protease Do
MTNYGGISMRKIFLILIGVLTMSSVALADVRNEQDGFVKVAEKVMPAVVNISTEKIITRKYADPFESFFNDPFFGGNSNQRRRGRDIKQKATSLGSGFVISEDGYIITNYHVIADAEKIEIKFADKVTYKAKIVGTDPETDIALLKIDGKNEKFEKVELGDSDKIKIGQWAIALGNPYGLNNSMTVGIVSAKGRSGMGIETYENFIQTDASINPGNSGGALVDIDGKVIGVNTAILSQTGGNVGIGFAIPINMVKNIIKNLKDEGKVTRGFLGVVLQQVDKKMADKFGMKKPKGALISDIVKDAPAEKAGIKRGDIILYFDGKELEDVNDAINKISNSEIGKDIKIKLLRDKKEIELIVKLVNKKDGDTKTEENRIILGMRLKALDDTLRSKMKYSKDKTGIIVMEVVNDSEAEQAGIEAGDLIKEIDKKEIKSIKEFIDIYELTKSGEEILLYVEGKKSRYIVIAKP